MSLNGMRIAAVFGGRSAEHEISVITACQAMAVLSALGAVVTPIYVTKQGRWTTAARYSELERFRQSLPEDGDPVTLDLATGTLRAGGSSLLARPREIPTDVIFPLNHGLNGEDGSVAALAQLAQIPVVGSGPLAGALAMHKYLSKQILRAAGQPVVEGRLVESAAAAAAAASEVGYPVVVKPNRGGSSIGVALVSDPAQLGPAVEVAFQFDSELILEPAVEGAQDLNCAVKRAGPRASEVERPLKEGGFLSYSDKYASDSGIALKSDGDSTKGDAKRELPAAIPADLRRRIQQLAVQAFDALDCRGTARVDFLVSDQGELFLNEVNTIPGSLAFYLWEATGVSFPALLEELVQEGVSSPAGRQTVLPGNLLAAGGVLGK